MRAPFVILAALGLAACQPAVPDSGVGFQDYSTYMRERDAQLAGTAPPAALPPAGSVVSGSPVFSTERLDAAITAAEGGAVAGSPPPLAVQPAAVAPVAVQPVAPQSGVRPRGDAPAGIRQESGEVAGASTGISDENDFNAVAARETIESDRARIEQNRAQYQVVQPTAVPQRQGGDAPNIVQFALSTSHAPGTPTYRRSSLRMTNPDAACARYASPDLAQEAFLAGGGPERDRKGLDPDGDGYACGWDPRPFRTALN